MINLIGILVFINIILVIFFIRFFKYKLDIKDNEIMERDKLLSERTMIIKNKNLKIKELENEIKRKNNKRL